MKELLQTNSGTKLESSGHPGIGFQPCAACTDQDGTLIVPIVAILWQQGAFLRFPAEVPVMTLTPLPHGLHRCYSAPPAP